MIDESHNARAMIEPFQLTLLEVPDIAFEIAMRLDNDSLRKLSALPLWPLFQSVIASRSQQFWYRRTELISNRTLEPRTSVCWKRVYYTLDGNLRQMFEYLPSLLVFREAGGEICTFAPYYIWSSLSCPDVLSYLVERELISTKLVDITAGLISVAERGLTEMIDPVLALIGAQHDAVHSALYEAVRTEHLSVVQKLFDRLEMTDIDHILSIASRHGHPSVVLWLLDQREINDCELCDLIRRAISRGQNELVTELISLSIPLPSTLELDAMLVYAIRAGKIEISELLRQLGAGSRTSAIDWSELIRDVVGESDLSGLISYVLSIAPVEHLPSDLLSIASHQGEAVFRLVLSDPRIDPMTELTSTMRAITGVYGLGEVMISSSLSVARRSQVGLDLILTLVRCERFRVERLDVMDIRLVLWSLYTVIWPKIEGFCDCGRRAGGATTPRQLSDLLESQGPVALIARYLLIKNPTATELVDWAIACRGPLFVTAARHVLSGELVTADQELVPAHQELVTLEALLLALLYPTLDLSDVIRRLALDGVGWEARVHAGRLLGLWFARQTGSE